MKKTLLIISSLIMFGLVSVPAMADDDDNDSGECIVGQVYGMSLAEEFGEGTGDITRCMEETDRVKLVMQVNKACRDTTVVYNTATSGYKLDNHANTCGASRGYGIAQMKNMIKDYKITHGIKANKLDLNIIVHGGGGTMMLNTPKNNLKPAVLALIADGVKFHFCMNTVRGMAKKMTAAKRLATGNNTLVVTPANVVSMVIPGVTYVTGGLTALGDFEELGYNYIHP